MLFRSHEVLKEHYVNAAMSPFLQVTNPDTFKKYRILKTTTIYPPMAAGETFAGQFKRSITIPYKKVVKYSTLSNSPNIPFSENMFVVITPVVAGMLDTTVGPLSYRYSALGEETLTGTHQTTSTSHADDGGQPAGGVEQHHVEEGITTTTMTAQLTNRATVDPFAAGQVMLTSEFFFNDN